jgi:hypothetical protein
MPEGEDEMIALPFPLPQPFIAMMPQPDARP